MRWHLVAYDVRATSPAQPRVAALARCLRARGHDLRLWTAREAGDWAAAIAVDCEHVPDPLHEAYARVAGLRRTRAPSPSEENASASQPSAGPGRLARSARAILGRALFPDVEAWWSRRVARRVSKCVRRGDVVMTFSRPESVGYVGERAQSFGATWWFDFADGWHYRGHRPEAMSGRRGQRELALEQRWVGAADGVSTVNDDLASWFRKHRDDGRLFVYPNIVPDELWCDERAPRRRDGPLRIAYFGRLRMSDPDTGLRPLLEALDLVDADSDSRRIEWLFRGDYTSEDRAEIAELERRSLSVDVGPPVPRVQLAKLADEVDAALVVTSPTQSGSTSKLLDGVGLRLPIFLIAPPGSLARRIVEDAKAGVVAPVDRRDQIARLWQDFVRRVELGTVAFDEVGRQRWSSRTWTEPLAGELEALAGHTAPGTAVDGPVATRYTTRFGTK